MKWQDVSSESFVFPSCCEHEGCSTCCAIVLSYGTRGGCGPSKRIVFGRCTTGPNHHSHCRARAAIGRPVHLFFVMLLRRGPRDRTLRAATRARGRAAALGAHRGGGPGRRPRAAPPGDAREAARGGNITKPTVIKRNISHNVSHNVCHNVRLNVCHDVSHDVRGRAASARRGGAARGGAALRVPPESACGQPQEKETHNK